MNCQTFAEMLTDLARERAAEQTTAENSYASDALVHLEECTACALGLQEDRALTHRLDELASEMKLASAPLWVEDELRKSFRIAFSRPGSMPSRALDRPPERPRHWNRWALSAAAVLLIMMGVTGLRLRERWLSPPGPQQVVTGEPQTSANRLPTIVTAGIGSLPPKSHKDFTGGRTNYRRIAQASDRNGKIRKQPTVEMSVPVAVDTASEVATHFMPLSYAGPINPQDGGQLVRVELSRSAMLSLGLPVNMDRYSERVKADVLFGADGLAHAIRFVQ